MGTPRWSYVQPSQTGWPAGAELVPAGHQCAASPVPHPFSSTLKQTCIALRQLSNSSLPNRMKEAVHPLSDPP